MSLYSLWFLAQNVIVITRRAWNKKVRYFFPLLVPVSLKSNESILQGITSWLIPITRWLGKKYHRAKNILKKTKHSLCKKWSFPLRIYSVNVTKSAGNCGNEILNGKLHFLRNDSKKTYFYSFSKCSERRCITAFHKIRFC